MVFSGLTVAIGLLSMIVLPVPMLRSVGYGGVLVPLVSVLVATTLLPVVLASVGPRMDWPQAADRAATLAGVLLVGGAGVPAPLGFRGGRAGDHGAADGARALAAPWLARCVRAGDVAGPRTTRW